MVKLQYNFTSNLETFEQMPCQSIQKYGIKIFSMMSFQTSFSFITYIYKLNFPLEYHLLSHAFQ